MPVSEQQISLNERAQHILKVLVEGYIQDGQPIGSRTLAKRSGLQLSPATIRNVMADLEEQGYISAPHTSAGRIPTASGYRFFVDSLLQIQPLESQIIQNFQGQLNVPQDPSGLALSASNLLSGVTALTGVVTVPKRSPAMIRQVEFLNLSHNQVLVILVMDRNEVQNRIIQVDQAIPSEELNRAANFLNEYLIGKSLQAARDVILSEMKEHREQMNRMMLSAIELGEKAFDNFQPASQGEEYVIAGETNLMSYEDLSDIQTLRDLFSAFTQKNDILTLLDKSIQADGVQIFIGSEAGHDAFDDCSLVTAPYSLGDDHIGVLGVIGPQRMPYEKVIPVVDVTARLLSVAMKNQL